MTRRAVLLALMGAGALIAAAMSGADGQPVLQIPFTLVGICLMFAAGVEWMEET